MRTKQEVEKELEEIEEIEEAEILEKQKQENYKRFLERESDFMIGKAHADLSFICKNYSDERRHSLMPEVVSITGNDGASFTGKAPVTESTKCYFRNVWDTSYTRYEDKFQKELNELTQKYITMVCEDLVCVLEMMGLQSNYYYVKPENFPEDKIKEIKLEIEKAQAEILNKYSDEKFIELIRKQDGWTTEEGERLPTYLNVDLSHSRMILYRYIFKNRPELQEKFKNTKFYEEWEQKIINKID